MDKGHFYFIEDQYFIDFPDNKLMKNKEAINGVDHDRPSFFAFEESTSGIFWMIPFSSKTQKFRQIYASKIQKNGYCDTILFGNVLGHEKAFLIQNMCPVTKEYILKEYISNNTPVTVDGLFEAELISKAKKILVLVRKGHKNLVFPDILEIEKQLLNK